jgi:hypothetical protein
LSILKGARLKPNRSKVETQGSSKPSMTDHNRSEQKRPDGNGSEQKIAVAAGAEPEYFIRGAKNFVIMVG